jgi:KUP system potassium uptake protein
MFVTFFDTSMVTLVALIVWRLPWYVVIVPWLIFACFDGTYLSSSLTKVPDGAWFTITLSIVLAAGFILWRYGKEAQWAAEASDRFPTSHFVTQDTEGNYRLKDKYGGEALSVTKGFGIFFDKAGEKTPIVFSNFITKLVSTPEVMVFFHMRPLEVPTVSDEARYTVTRLALPNCYRLVVRHGYMDEVVTPDLAAMIYGQISKYILQQQLPSTPTDDPIKTDDARSSSADEAQDDDEKAAGTRSSVVEVPLASSTIPAKLCQLRQAYEHRVLYILGKEEMNITAGTRLWRQLVLKMFLFLRENTRNKMANLAVPTDKLVEIGFVKDV